MIRFALPIAALAATACHPVPPAQTPPPAEGAACNAEGLDDLIGKARSEVVAADARNRSGASVVRWLTPDMIVTMEYREDRLNLHLGTDGRIGSVRCG
jgi:hypothetical protein